VKKQKNAVRKEKECVSLRVARLKPSLSFFIIEKKEKRSQSTLCMREEGAVCPPDDAAAPCLRLCLASRKSNA
jgi:hypothetical protein